MIDAPQVQKAKKYQIGYQCLETFSGSEMVPRLGYGGLVQHLLNCCLGDFVLGLDIAA